MAAQPCWQHSVSPLRDFCSVQPHCTLEHLLRALLTHQACQQAAHLPKGGSHLTCLAEQDPCCRCLKQHARLKSFEAEDDCDLGSLLSELSLFCVSSILATLGLPGSRLGAPSVTSACCLQMCRSGNAPSVTPDTTRADMRDLLSDVVSSIVFAGKACH